MIIQFSIYVIPYLVALLITIPYVVIIFRIKSSADLKITAFLLIFSVVWIFGLALEIINATIIGKIIFKNIGYIGSTSIPVIIFILSAKLAGFSRLIKKGIIIAISIIPAADVVFHIINNVYGLLQKTLTVLPNGVLEAVPVKGYKITSQILLGYSGILVFFSLIFLFLILAGRHKFFRRQALILLLSMIIVFTLDTLYVLKIMPFMTNISPFALSLGWIIYWTAGQRYLKMGEFVPINYESIIENINDSVLVLDKRNIINFMNKPAQDLFSTGPDFMGKHVDFFWPDYNLNFPGGILEFKKDIIIHTESQNKYFDVSLSPVKVRPAEIAGKLVIMKDITERKSYEKKIKYMSFHDYLTGLYNRAFFEEELVRLNVERNLPLSIVLGDVNGLKMINDTYGHDKGDELLKIVAEILKQNFRKSDIVSRWGGDEFIVLLPLTDYSIAEVITERIHAVCSEHQIENMPLSISLGIATKVNKDENIEETIKAAEDKMYANKMSDERRTHRSIISSLEKSLDEKKYETEQHVERMRDIALMIGKDLNLSEDKLNDLILLSALHDIGKIAISDSIIKKPGKLSPQEWEEVKKHPEVGYRIAKSSTDLAAIAEAILTHHENWDGTGYPEGLKNDNIPLISRIISIADAYDAMTNDRPYRKALAKEEAIAEIKKYSNTKYDPNIVKIFLKIINKK